MNKKKLITTVSIILVLLVIGVVILMSFKKDNSENKNTTTSTKIKDMIVLEESYYINGLNISKVEINPNTKELKVFYSLDVYGTSFTLLIYNNSSLIGQYTIDDSDYNDGFVLINYQENLDYATHFSADFMPIVSLVGGE